MVTFVTWLKKVPLLWKTLGFIGLSVLLSLSLAQTVVIDACAVANNSTSVVTCLNKMYGYVQNPTSFKPLVHAAGYMVFAAGWLIGQSLLSADLTD